MLCDEIAPSLAGVVDGSLRLDRADRRHLDRCLACQAEVARYRKLLRTMHAMGAVADPAPPGLLAEVLAYLDEAGDRGAMRATLTGRRVAYLGGIAAATAAAGAGAAIVLVSRGRRGRLPLAG